MKKRLDVGDAFHFIIQISGVRLHHSDLLVFLSERATCEKEKALAVRKLTTFGFESQRPTPTPRRPGVSCISYYRREEPIYNRSEWCRGKALAFKTRGRGFAPRQRFVFFTCSAFAFTFEKRRAGGPRTHDLWFWTPAPYPYATPTCCFLFPFRDI